MVSSRELDRLLSRAERVLALLDRCRPVNWDAELSRVTDAWRRGEPIAPHFRYSPAPDVSDWLRLLEAIAQHAREAAPLGHLYGERAAELWLEAKLVQNIGTPGFSAWAGQRFARDESADGKLADSWAAEWITLHEPIVEETIASDDERDSRSLVAVMRREVGRLRLPVRIVVTRELASAAAAADGVVYVRAGLRHTEHDARRIVLHEIFGHVLPRVRARFAPLGILRVGTRGSSEDEEGRALLLERRAALFDVARRREVARRHLSACAIRAGGDWVETVRELRIRGANLEEAIAVSARACRGGGLAREIVYLPALARVTRCFEQTPELERWFLAGRVSTTAASFLTGLMEEPPESFTTAGDEEERNLVANASRTANEACSSVRPFQS